MAGVATESNVEFLLVSSGNKISYSWILDSGYILYMCANRDWFYTYEKKNEAEVFMGNDDACKVIGIGMVKVKMYGDIVLTFGNMRHVPTLKKTSFL